MHESQRVKASKMSRSWCKLMKKLPSKFFLSQNFAKFQFVISFRSKEIEKNSKIRSLFIRRVFLGVDRKKGSFDMFRPQLPVFFKKKRRRKEFPVFLKSFRKSR
jgi:hypothetical protein